MSDLASPPVTPAPAATANLHTYDQGYGYDLGLDCGEPEIAAADAPEMDALPPGSDGDYRAPSHVEQLESELKILEFIPAPPLPSPVRYDRPIHIDDYLKMESTGQDDIWGDGIITGKSFGLGFGESSIGKSSLFVDLSLHLAAGRDFLGHKVPKPITVLYLMSEVSFKSFQKRVARSREIYGITGKIPFYFSPPGVIPKAGKPDGLIKYIKDVGAELTVLDTYFDFFPKLKQENDNSDVKINVFRILKEIVEETGTTFLLVTHTGKPSKDRPSGKYSFRGASDFLDDSHFSFYLSNVTPKAKKAIDSKKKPHAVKTNSNRLRLLYIGKVKGGNDEIEPLVLDFDKESGVFRLEDESVEAINNPRLKAIAAFVKEKGSATTQEINVENESKFKVGVSSTGKDLKLACELGMIRHDGKGIYKPPVEALDQAQGSDPVTESL